MNRDKLWQAIFELYELLQHRANAESRYQGYFETNCVVFESLGFDVWKSFEKKSGNRLPMDEEREKTIEPDFICGNVTSGVVTIFELKIPFSQSALVKPSSGTRTKLKAELTGYVAQAEEYVESITGNSNIRQSIRDILNIPKIASYEIVIVYGLEEANEPVDIQKIVSRSKTPTKVLHYDRLLDQLAKQWLAGRTDENRNGLCAYYFIQFYPCQIHERAFIADYGSDRLGRFRIYIEEDVLTIECVDNRGKSYSLSGKITPLEMTYLRFEFASDARGTYMELDVNNVVQDIRLSKVKFDLSGKFSNGHIGSDTEGKNCGRFQLKACYHYDTTMTILGKIQFYKWFKERLLKSALVMDFNGMTFMYLDDKMNLQQKDPKLQPINQYYPGQEEADRINREAKLSDVNRFPRGKAIDINTGEVENP